MGTGDRTNEGGKAKNSNDGSKKCPQISLPSGMKWPLRLNTIFNLICFPGLEGFVDNDICNSPTSYLIMDLESSHHARRFDIKIALSFIYHT